MLARGTSFIKLINVFNKKFVFGLRRPIDGIWTDGKRTLGFIDYGIRKKPNLRILHFKFWEYTISIGWKID